MPYIVFLLVRWKLVMYGTPLIPVGDKIFMILYKTKPDTWTNSHYPLPLPKPTSPFLPNPTLPSPLLVLMLILSHLNPFFTVVHFSLTKPNLTSPTKSNISISPMLIYSCPNIITRILSFCILTCIDQHPLLSSSFYPPHIILSHPRHIRYPAT